MILLSTGESIAPEEIETHYCRSLFIKEICVIGGADSSVAAEGLFAVVVPDLDRLRAKRIVNAGDLLRFEMEGLSAELPGHQRVLRYEIRFAPLPRQENGVFNRDEVRRLAAEQRARQVSGSDRAWMQEPHAAEVLAAIGSRLTDHASLHPDANLEIDLGFDSMARVELLTELECRFGAKLAAETLAGVFTVRQLVAALAGSPRVAARNESLRPWALLLRDLPQATDPILGGLLAKRRIAAPLLHAAARMIRAALFRVELTGLENLPRSGPYIICPNHQSYLDPFMLCPMLPFRYFKNLFFVGAVEYFETPLTKWFARIANLVPVDPDSNLVPAMQAGAFGLAHGKALVLFPEGERSIDGTVKKFKKGSAILAQHMRVPIVPVAIKGVYDLWPRGRSFNWRLLRPWSRHKVSIVIGQPMTFAESADYNDTALALRERVKAMWMRI